MDKDKILKADFLDLLFDGRNKEYGAYELRRSYNKRISVALIAMLITLGAVGAVVALNGGKNNEKAQMQVADVSLEDIKKQEEKRPEPPPPPPPKPPDPPKIEITKFTPPKVVKDNEVKEDEKPPEQEKLDDTKIGAINQEGVKTDVIAPPVEKVGTGTVIPPKVEEDYDKEFKTVQIEAKYPGGASAWTNFLRRNLRSDVPMENGASPGRYTVLVSFIVDKDGNTSEVKAENDPGYGVAAEAVRVIKSSGKWQPAEQNGHKVIYRQKQQVTFEVQDQ
jgi:protein TonB